IAIRSVLTQQLSNAFSIVEADPAFLEMLGDRSTSSEDLRAQLRRLGGVDVVLVGEILAYDQAQISGMGGRASIAGTGSRATEISYRLIDVETGQALYSSSTRGQSRSDDQPLVAGLLIGGPNGSPDFLQTLVGAAGLDSIRMLAERVIPQVVAM